MKTPQKIRMLRESQNLTQIQVAEQTNMSVSSYAKLERGERKISVDELTRVAETLQVSPAQLLDNDKQNILCFVNSNSNQNINYYANIDVQSEIDKLQLIISNQQTLLKEKDELIAEQKSHIKTLQAVIANQK